MTEQSVVITGAAGGVGQALVDEFRGSGWRVIGTDVENRPEQLVVDDWVQGDLSATSTRGARQHRRLSPERLDQQCSGPVQLLISNDNRTRTIAVV